MLSNPPLPEESGNSQNYLFTEISIGNTYYFAIKAFDDNNNSSDISNSPFIEFLGDQDPPSPIDDLTAQQSNDNAELSWTAPGDDGNIGTAQSYDIRVSELYITEENWNDAEQLPNPPIPDIAGTIQSYIFDNVEIGIHYYFAIKTIDDNENISTISNIAEYEIIGDTTPPSAITDLMVVEGISSNLHQISITWTAVGDDGSVGTATSYDVRYSTEQITNSNWNFATPFTNTPTPQISGEEETLVINDLQEGIILYFGIKVYDEANNESGLSNIPGGKIVYQINSNCINCFRCINDCPTNAIYQGPGQKLINPDLCDACGICLDECPWSNTMIDIWVFGYNQPIRKPQSFLKKLFNK